jgi:hypothetical protein
MNLVMNIIGAIVITTAVFVSAVALLGIAPRPYRIRREK